MRPEKRRVGARVRVADGQRRTAHLAGAQGTVERIYRTSERTALHVRLDDGCWQLLWPEEVEPLREELQRGKCCRQRGVLSFVLLTRPWQG